MSEYLTEPIDIPTATLKEEGLGPSEQPESAETMPWTAAVKAAVDGLQAELLAARGEYGNLVLRMADLLTTAQGLAVPTPTEAIPAGSQPTWDGTAVVWGDPATGEAIAEAPPGDEFIYEFPGTGAPDTTEFFQIGNSDNQMVNASGIATFNFSSMSGASYGGLARVQGHGDWYVTVIKDDGAPDKDGMSSDVLLQVRTVDGTSMWTWNDDDVTKPSGNISATGTAPVQQGSIFRVNRSGAGTYGDHFKLYKNGVLRAEFTETGSGEWPWMVAAANKADLAGFKTWQFFPEA